MAVNTGARLDRLPLSAFHRRIMVLIAIGMFFDGFDIYVASTVLGATLKSGFSTIGQNALYVSMTFLGMTLGALITGFLGDRFGRRFTYQSNLMIFGLASLASAFAPSMGFLIACRFLMGFGLGAENVVGYSTLAEFVPPKVRGRLQGWMAVAVVTGLPISALTGLLLVPTLGWRVMYVLGGLGAIAVWYARKAMPESPRWLESVGRNDEAETLMTAIEQQVALEKGPLPAPAVGSAAPVSRALRSLVSPLILPRMLVGCLVLVVINTLLYGFVTWLPTFFVSQGMTIAKSFTFAFIMSLGAPAGSAIGALTADRLGRKTVIIGASALAIVFGAIYPFAAQPMTIMLTGLMLVIPVYILVALLFGIYVPELFPTEIRLRAAGICNTVGRGATIVTPFIVVSLFSQHGIIAVLALMIGLLILQIVAVAIWGIEPKGRGLETLIQQEAPRDAGKPAVQNA
jgi:MFS transporter, putative metabolite:H+ symporter